MEKSFPVRPCKSSGVSEVMGPTVAPRTGKGAGTAEVDNSMGAASTSSYCKVKAIKFMLKASMLTDSLPFYHDSQTIASLDNVSAPKLQTEQEFLWKVNLLLIVDSLRFLLGLDIK